MGLKVAGLVFSARRKGNGFHCMKYCLDKLEKKGFVTLLVNAFDFEIKACSHCDYECYAEEIKGRREDCPIEDDVPKMFGMVRDADWLLFAIPCYGGHAPAIYKAWAERIPHLPELNQLVKKDFERFRKLFLNKIKGVIIIGNLTGMGDMTLHEVMADFYNIEPPEAILIQSREFGLGSLKGNLIENLAVREKLDRFVKLLVKTFQK